MDLFVTSDFPASSYVNLSSPASPASLLADLQLEDSNTHDNFIRFLQHAQKLDVRILPLVWEARLEKLGLEGATGRVDQRTWNAQMQFAFKRFKPDLTGIGVSETHFRELQYNAMINEITILSSPTIKDHPNVAVFIGVGFDVVHSTGQIWPVLVFLKANQGDLATFFSTNEVVEGDDLLGICCEVSKGLYALHNCNVVHGDLKPGNILMWRKTEPEDIVSVALADFGFSSFASSDDAFVRVSRSEPWEAPEWHTRYFTLTNAKKMDIYSFGLLCFWMFFRNQGLAEFGFPSATVNSAFLRTNLEATAAIQSLKKDGNAMLCWALKLLQERKDLTDRTRSCLERVFKWTLVYDREARHPSMETVARSLSGKDDLKDQLSGAEGASISVPNWHGGLDVEQLFFDLDACDYRVPSFLAKCLRQMADAADCHPCAQNAAFQLALCHSFGFGVARSESECASWLDRSGRAKGDLTAVLERIKNSEPKAQFIANLASRGYRNDLPQRYSQDGILGAAIEDYHSMVLARSDTLGPNHFSTLRLKDILIKMLRWNDDNQEALDLVLETLQSPGLKTSDRQDLKYTLSLIHADMGNTAEAEKAGKEILQATSDDSGEASTERLDYESNLVDILISKGQFEDAIGLGERTVEDCVKELGPEHSSSRASKRSLAKAYIGAGDLPRALEIMEELVRTQENTITLHNPSPKLVEDASLLGVLYFRTGAKDSALSYYDMIQGWISRDREYAKFATNAVNNHATSLIKRGAIEEARVILEALLQECNKALGSDSEEAALVMGNLDYVFHELGKWENTEPLGKQVVETRRRILGPSHPKTIIAMGNYRAALLAQNKVTRAVEIAKDEIRCVKDAVNATNESVIHALLTISSSLESAGAFAEAIPFLKEAAGLEHADSHNPQQGVLFAVLLEAICYLQLRRTGEARDAIFRLLASFTVPFKEILNTFIPELLRLAEICLERGWMVEAEQTLVGAMLLSQKSPLLDGNVKAKVDAAVSRYIEVKGAERVELSFNPFLIRNAMSVENEDI